MKVLFVASECAPFIKTGGLADVIGALPKALFPFGVSVRVLLPAYPALESQLSAGSVVDEWSDLYGGSARLVSVTSSGLDLLLLDAPHLYDRPGNIYVNEQQQDWDDNHLRFGALSWVGAQIARAGAGEWRPDIINAHDWQAGMVAVYLKQHSERSPPVVQTVHNIAFQGLFDVSTLSSLGVSTELYTPEGVEFYSRVSFLKAGLKLADRITTVSPTYARELLMPEFGMGLEGLLQSRESELQGILNGIDLDVWNPQTDAALIATYSVDNLDGKDQNRIAVESRFALKGNPDSPLFCVVSRLTEQKGLDLLLECLPYLVSQGARLALLGSGDTALENAFLAAARQYEGTVGVIIGYDEPLSHLLQGGSDAILIPSRFEPCGLTQLYGLRYGTVPVVAQTGGLADTVIDANEAALSCQCATGIQFSPVTAAALRQAIGRTCRLYADKTQWLSIVKQGMRQSVGWEQSAKNYRTLYQSLIDTQHE